MKIQHFKKIVGEDGTVSLADLPPHQEVEIVVLYPEPDDWQAEFQRWLVELRENHPLSGKNKAEVLKQLRQPREKVWTERHKD